MKQLLARMGLRFVSAHGADSVSEFGASLLAVRLNINLGYYF